MCIGVILFVSHFRIHSDLAVMGDMGDFEMVSNYAGEQKSADQSSASDRDVHVHLHIHMDRSLAGMVDPTVSDGPVSRDAASSQQPLRPEIEVPHETTTNFHGYDYIEHGRNDSSCIEQPLFMIDRSHVFHRKGCHCIKQFFPIVKTGRLKAFLPCICVTSLTAETYYVDGRIIHRRVVPEVSTMVLDSLIARSA